MKIYFFSKNRYVLNNLEFYFGNHSPTSLDFNGRNKLDLRDSVETKFERTKKRDSKSGKDAMSRKLRLNCVCYKKKWSKTPRPQKNTNSKQ